MIIGSPAEFAVIVANHSVIGQSRHDAASIEVRFPRNRGGMDYEE
jgi:hypothetical protein